MQVWCMTPQEQFCFESWSVHRFITIDRGVFGRDEMISPDHAMRAVTVSSPSRRFHKATDSDVASGKLRYSPYRRFFDCPSAIFVVHTSLVTKFSTAKRHTCTTSTNILKNMYTGNKKNEHTSNILLKQPPALLHVTAVRCVQSVLSTNGRRAIIPQSVFVVTR